MHTKLVVMAQSIGETIREQRSLKGWSQEELAVRCGLSRNHVANVERGANVSVSVLEQLAQALGVEELPLGNIRLVARNEKLNKTGIRRAIDEAEAQLIRARKLLGDDSKGKKPGATKGPASSRAALSLVPQEPSSPVRIYLVEDDDEHADWRERIKDFASRSDQVEWRRGEHTPAKYHAVVQGNVAAGHGAELQMVDDEDLRQIPDHYWEKKGARFVLRVRGNSLERRGIVDHDLVFVKPLDTREPKNNSIVIAELDDKLCVKIWKKVNGKPFLFSASPSFPKPIDPRKHEHFSVKGVVVGRSGYALDDDGE